MRVAILGATGGTGRAVIRALLDGGGVVRAQRVTALVRQPQRLDAAQGLTIVPGDAMREADVAAVVQGHDAVVVSLGNSQNPFALMFGAARTTPRDVCEAGTRNVVAAMRGAGVMRLIVVTAFGIGDTRARLPLMFKLFYRLVLREHMADKERQEQVVKASGLDWTLVQPVGLTDAATSGDYFASTSGELRRQQIGRGDVAAYIAKALATRADVGRTVALSG